MKKKILILCTGNSCRSQMAEGFLKSFEGKLEAYSAGTYPEKNISPYAVEVMKEIGIDISSQRPKNVEQFISIQLDYLITVCDNAKESCPNFIGEVKHKIHIPFEDPAKVKGDYEFIIEAYRKVRDEIRAELELFYRDISS